MSPTEAAIHSFDCPTELTCGGVMPAVAAGFGFDRGGMTPVPAALKLWPHKLTHNGACRQAAADITIQRSVQASLAGRLGRRGAAAQPCLSCGSPHCNQSVPAPAMQVLSQAWDQTCVDRPFAPLCSGGGLRAGLGASTQSLHWSNFHMPDAGVCYHH